jgi:hypothetical protein
MARWITHNPNLDENQVGQTIIAHWFPGRFYLVQTILFVPDNDSSLSKLIGNITGKDSRFNPESQTPYWVTNVVRCTKDGLGDYGLEDPLYETNYPTRDEAVIGHQLAVEKFS